MAAGRVRLRLDLGKLNAKAGVVSAEAVKRAADRTEQRVRSNIAADDLINSGGLINSVTQRDIPGNALLPRRAIGSPKPYVKYPERGTRAHGPVRARALRFQPKGSGRVVFAKWVRGVRAYGFMKRALDQLRPTDFE